MPDDLLLLLTYHEEAKEDNFPTNTFDEPEHYKNLQKEIEDYKREKNFRGAQLTKGEIKEFLKAQLDTLKHNLQEDQSELIDLDWRYHYFGRRTYSYKKKQRQQHIRWLQIQIKGREQRIVQLKIEERGTVSAETELIEKLRKEKRELQEDLFTLQEKSRLDNHEIERFGRKVVNLEEENETLRRQLEDIQIKEATLEEKIQLRKNTLARLKTAMENKLEADSQRSFLDTLLNSQEQLVRLENAPSSICSLIERQLEKAKQKLNENLTDREVNRLCQVQIELIKLMIQMEQKT